MIKYLLFLLLSLGSVYSLSPLILVNGIGGSVLKATVKNRENLINDACRTNSNGSFTVWIDVFDLTTAKKRQCWLENLRVIYDDTSKTYSGPQGVTINGSVDFGGVKGLEYIDDTLSSKEVAYFHELIINLEERLGYKVGVDLHGAPYDWRMAPDALGDYFVQLKGLIETTVARNGKTAHLISQSAGSAVLLHFLQAQTQQWKTAHISDFIVMGPAFGGSPKAIRGMLSGNDFGIPLVTPADAFELYSSLPSAVWFMPMREMYGDGVIVNANGTEYTVNDYENLIDATGLTQAKVLYQKFKGMSTLAPPLVDTFLLYSAGVPTENSYKFTEIKGEGLRNDEPEITFVDGDGTLPASQPRKIYDLWKSAHNSAGKDLEIKEFAYILHADMANNDAFISHIVNHISTRDNVPIIPPYVNEKRVISHIELGVGNCGIFQSACDKVQEKFGSLNLGFFISAKGTYTESTKDTLESDLIVTAVSTIGYPTLYLAYYSSATTFNPNNVHLVSIAKTLSSNAVTGGDSDDMFEFGSHGFGLGAMFHEIVEFKDMNENGVYDVDIDTKHSSYPLNGVAWEPIVYSNASDKHTYTLTSKDGVFTLSVSTSEEDMIDANGQFVTPNGTKFNVVVEKYPRMKKKSSLAVSVLLYSNKQRTVLSDLRDDLAGRLENFGNKGYFDYVKSVKANFNVSHFNNSGGLNSSGILNGTRGVNTTVDLDTGVFMSGFKNASALLSGLDFSFMRGVVSSYGESEVSIERSFFSFGSEGENRVEWDPTIVYAPTYLDETFGVLGEEGATEPPTEIPEDGAGYDLRVTSILSVFLAIVWMALEN